MPKTQIGQMKTRYFFLTIAFFLLSCAQKQEFPYQPATYRTPICFTDDWQKSLVDQKGRLNYDFGPGPYARPKTEIAFGAKNQSLEFVSQTQLSARVPIVITTFDGENLKIQQQAFALTEDWYPHLPADPNIGFASKRTLGFTGALGWAQPTRKCDPAFRNVASGTGRPIRYAVSVAPGSRKQVALGFCDSYREKGKITRVMILQVEGAMEQEIDLLVSGEQNEPQAFLFDAQDNNRDGKIDIEVRASSNTQDPNVLINAIWVFPDKMPVSMDALISGELTSAAETYVDCGNELQWQAMPRRRDAILADFMGTNFTPVVQIKTGRQLTFHVDTGMLLFQNKPFLSTRPVAQNCEKTSDGWELVFQSNTAQIELVVYHGEKQNSEQAAFPELTQAAQDIAAFWENQVDLPWHGVRLPDKRMQNLFESSVRVLYQIRENVDGFPQFQPGPSVYRGFWASDGIWDADAAMLVGDFDAAQHTVDRFIEHQAENGRIEIMSPSLLHRETAHFIWLLHRYATLKQDTTWLRDRWSYLEKAVRHYQHLRREASVDSTAPYFGLTPPGLTDGGIGGINAEYGGVYWGLIGFKSAVAAADMLGKDDQAQAWRDEFDDFLSAFRRAAERDLRTDANGHPFLPMKMMQTGDIPHPQRGQGQLCHAIYPGGIFDLDDPFVAGMLKIFDEALVEGLVQDTGWLKGGVWPFFATHRGLAEMWLGRTEKAQAALVALADHAAPTYLWVEEQMPQDKGTRIAGDTPQTNANAQFIRLLRHLLILERGSELHLLHGLPSEWLTPSAELSLAGMPTTFGRCTLSLKISQDGKMVELRVARAEQWFASASVALSLKALKSKGFALKNAEVTPDVWTGELSKDIELQFVK